MNKFKSIKNFQSEFVYQIVALVLSFVLIHTIYVGLVRPNAEVVLRAEQATIAQQKAAGVSVNVERSAWVVLKDYEQEACFILMLWAIAILTMKSSNVRIQQRLMQQDLVNIEAGTRVLPEDARILARPLESLDEHEKDMLVARALRAALTRYGSTGSVQDAFSVVRDICDDEADRLDSELSLIRYITWAIPSIGFIGTVRGIGEALGNAHQAVEGDITAVTASLGVAFNSTFVALLISIIITFLMHQITISQERLVRQASGYCDEKLIRHMQA